MAVVEKTEAEKQAEVAAAEDAQAAAEFASGFADTPTPAAAAAPAPVEVIPVPAPVPEPKYAQITEAQWNDMLAKSTKIDKIEADFGKRIDTAMGRYGELGRTLQQLQSATPAGMTIEVTDDVVADIKEEFPELSDRMLKSFKAFAGKFKGAAPTPAPAPAAAPAAAPAPVDPTVVAQEMDAKVQQRFVAAQAEALEDEYPNWREIVGTPDQTTNAFRVWLAKQPAEYQQKLNSTNSAVIIGRSIAKYKTDAAAPAPAPAATNTRSERVRSAVAPRGTPGAPVPAGNTAQDEFRAGFESG